jgi:hypothetical protein
MKHGCFYCNKKINKDEDFVLIGKYPGYFKRTDGRSLHGAHDLFGLEKYGELYHWDCYFYMLEDKKYINLNKIFISNLLEKSKNRKKMD